MKKYKVHTKYVFAGHYIVTAENGEQARQAILNGCGLTLSGSLHCSLPDERVDWNFGVHPQKIISKVERIKTKEK